MIVITTHLHADFDCVASMLAASKLYPDATIVFSGSQEKNVRDFLAQTDFPLNHRRLKGFDLDSVKQVVVVDASLISRIGPFAKLVGKEGVSFHLYDHHPSENIDIPYEEAVIKERGATATIMVELLKEKNIKLTEEEATLVALGIYEDTGSLTFSSVRKEDFHAAAWLHEQGADLTVVSDYLNREMNPAQVETLNSLLKNLSFESSHGVTVAVASADAQRHVGDVAGLATKVMEMEGLSTLFVFVRIEDRIQMVARSRSDAVDAGAVAERLGGGGHPSAASATIKGMTLTQSIDRLYSALDEVIEMAPNAGEVMTTHVIDCAPKETIRDIETMMTRFDINGMPVVKDKIAIGIITRQIVEKAIHHDVGDHLASEYMITEFDTVTKDTSMTRLENLTLSSRQKLVPVVDEESGRLVGIVTRGMALSKLYGDMLKDTPSVSFQGGARRRPIVRDVASQMKDNLPESILDLFKTVKEVADELDQTAYVVGGFVRDLLLRIPNNDVDIVIEGDGIAFAKALGKRVNGRVRPHEKFKTAVVVLPDRFKIDVATARVEYYAYPAALPTVRSGAIRNDLYRRDFSLNAMAIRLNGKRPDSMIDYFGGQADLKDHVVRVLHNLSFVEDPTRAFRAARFETRYGFSMGKQTLSLLKSAIRNKLFNRLSPSRLFSEIRLILSERRPAAALTRLNELGLLKFLSPEVSFDSEGAALIDSLSDLIAWRKLSAPDESFDSWFARFLALTDSVSDKEIKRLEDVFTADSKYFGSAGEIRINGRKAMRKLLSIKGKAPDSAVYKHLAPFSTEALLYFAAKSKDENLSSYVTRYLTKLKDIKPFLSGADLIAIGAKEDKSLGNLLVELFGAQLDGKFSSKKEAIDYANSLLEASTTNLTDDEPSGSNSESS